MLLEEQLSELDYEVIQAGDGLEALEMIEQREPDLILLDIDMPKLDGLSLCARLKAHPTRRLIPVVLITGSNDRHTRIRGLEAGADDFLAKPFDANELLVRTRVLLRDRALNKRLDGAESVILALARVVEARDMYTIHHAERVGLYSREIGSAHGVPEEEREVLYRGGVLHDLGKAVISSDILLKAGPLNSSEWEIMRSHSEQGAQICGPLRSTSDMLPIIRHHHERMDGAGYPDRLVGAAIPLGARIAAVADAWDAMTNHRAYRKALEPDEARRRMLEGRGTQWDPNIIDIFLGLLESGRVASIAAQLYGPK